MQVLNIDEFADATNSAVLEKAKQLQLEVAHYRALLTRALPYLKELNAENYSEPAVGIFQDYELDSITADVEANLAGPNAETPDQYRARRMNQDGICEQDIADTAPDEPIFK